MFGNYGTSKLQYGQTLAQVKEAELKEQAEANTPVGGSYGEKVISALEDRITKTPAPAQTEEANK